MPLRKLSEEERAERAVAKATASKIQSFVDENIEEIIERLWELSKASKGVWVTCENPACRKKQCVTVPDTIAATRTLELLMLRGLGRPREVAVEEGGLTVVRTVVPPSEQKREASA